MSICYTIAVIISIFPMSLRILAFVSLLCSILFACPIFAEEDYIGTDLGNDIYKRIDTGVYKIKKQLIENRLKGSALLLDGMVGMSCASKTEKIFCFRDGVDFTSTELDDIA